MLQFESNGFTEFEEDIRFDEDDPDFDDDLSDYPSDYPLLYKMPSRMSLTSVHPVDLHSSRGSLLTLSHSLDDITKLSLNWTPHVHSDHVLTIEELRLEMTSCFTCGVSWNDSHVSLDCSECGGYALERPCPVCEGTCGARWKRDLSLSHGSNKAKWQGECALAKSKGQNDRQLSNNVTTQELTTRLEKLSANS